MAYGKEDVKNLMFNLIEPKIQKLLEWILKHSLSSFMEVLGVKSGDRLEKTIRDFFEWMVLDSEMLRQEFHLGKLDHRSPEPEKFCKEILGFDIVASEIVRIASIFGLNEKFKSNDEGQNQTTAQ